MGNCQAVDAASLVIQHPNGKVDKLYWPVSASHVMKLNPGHYVALLITTTTISHNNNNKNSSNSPVKPSNDTKNSSNSPVKPSNDTKNSKNNSNSTGRNSVRITRVKLLRPKDTLALGHVYRLISAQEVTKGLVAKKQAKMKKNGIELADSEGLKEAEKLVKLTLQDKTHLASRHGQRNSRTTTASSGTNRPKTWQPSLNSISEAAS